MQFIISYVCLFIHQRISDIHYSNLQRTTVFIILVPGQYRDQNLRQGIVLKTSFKTRVSRMGLGSFVNINIFVMKYCFIQFVYILNFFRISEIKINTNVKTPKRKPGSFVQRYSFKFRALSPKFKRVSSNKTPECPFWGLNILQILIRQKWKI